MKPIRSEKKQSLVCDPWGFGEKIASQVEVFHFLSDAGEIISYHTERQVAFDCGCLGKPVGGYCIECMSEGFRGLICSECFSHCRCGRPICQSHSGFISFGGCEGLRLCGLCYRNEMRRLMFNKVMNFLLP